MRPRDEVPTVIKALGKTIDLKQNLLAKMIDVMTSLPMSIGDFLKHPKGKGVDPNEAVAALQTLVATCLGGYRWRDQRAGARRFGYASHQPRRHGRFRRGLADRAGTYRKRAGVGRPYHGCGGTDRRHGR